MTPIDKILWKVNYIKDKNWLEAINILNESIIDHPNNAKLYIEIAKIFHKKRLYDEALENYKIALKNSEDKTNLYFTIGNIYLTMNKAKIALKYYDEITKDFSEAMYNRAIAYIKIKENKKAVALLQKLIKEFPNNQIAYYFLVEQLGFQKNYNQSIAYLEMAEKKFGKQGKIFFLKGLNYFYLKNWIKSYTELQKADKLKYSKSNFYHIFGLCSEKIGKTDDAISLLRYAIDKDPFNSMNYIDLANILILHKRPNEALKMVEAAKKINPTSILITLTMNKLLKSMKENDEDNS